MHDSLGVLLTKNALEGLFVILVQVVVDERLTTEFVDSLGNLVASSETKTREQR
jgi:hypothetical protein